MLKNIIIDEYDYELPEERIAQYPVRERDISKLLIWNKGEILQDVFRNIHEYVPEGSLVIFNNSKVIKARLLFKKESGASVEILCLEPIDPPDYESSFNSALSTEWKCIVGNLKKWKQGKISLVFRQAGRSYNLYAEKVKPDDGETWIIKFTWDTGPVFAEVLEAAGHIPLPPYIGRPDESADAVTYQTVYSSVMGSVAAPTAGLHFSSAVLQNLKKRNTYLQHITLHVGAGTFQPVKVRNALHHKMHHEHFSIGRQTILALMKHQGRIIPVGTTTVRTLESIYWIGAGILNGTTEAVNTVSQWDPYKDDRNIPVNDSLEAILRYLEKNDLKTLTASTGIMIVPGYKFRLANGIITNFHQPKSTLLLLISAWTGENWKGIYRYALDHDFRFLSYGDSSLLL